MALRMVSRVVLLLILATACVALASDSTRLKSLSGKVLCDCGCREVLGECSHKVCQRKPAMRQEISAALTLGKSDDQILRQIAAAHGNDILVTPMFQGFNTLLWIVPVTVGVIAVGATWTIQRRRTGAK